MSGTSYIASDDSALIRKVLRDHSGGSALEIGAGNGGNLIGLRERFVLVVGTDLVRPAMEDWSEAGADYVLADGASCARDSTFDLVAFNPPYLRGATGDAAVDGGEDLRVPKRFLEEGLRVVKVTGVVVFLLDQEAAVGEFEAICAGKGFRMDKVASQKGFFEELSVYVAARDHQLR